jgi:hypothetical protein
MTTATAPAPALTRHVLVTQTYVFFDAREGYEIHLASDDAKDAPTTVLVTRDRDLYRLALEAEGTARRFEATWHHGHRRNKKPCKVFDALAEIVGG